MQLDLEGKCVLFRFRGTTNDKMRLQAISKLELEKNGSSFGFEELQTIIAQLQMISKLDLGVKWLNVSFQRTINEKK